MSIFDKVKQGMLDSTKAIKEISSDVSEKTKLKAALSKDQMKVEEAYYNLGKNLYTVYEENPDVDCLSEDILFILADLKSTLERIKEYEEKLDALKGIIKCDKCDQMVDENTKFCPNCGKKLENILIKEIAEGEKSEEISAPSEEDKTE